MSEHILNELRAKHPIVVNSYQGAFGPPTQGHYDAMMFSARAHLERYTTGKIIMLFMPTAKSSDKKHLLPTQSVRIEILNMYCQKLQDTLALEGILENRIEFIASELEYRLADDGKSTSTINTIRALNTIGCDITLTMGLDNLFDLPYWSEVEKYSEILASPAIYVPGRDISTDDEAKLIEPFGKGVKFGRSASFSPSKTWELVAPTTKAKLEELLERIVLLGKPSPTSSTLLRCGLYALYGAENNQWNSEYVPYVHTIQGIRPQQGDPWHRFYGIVEFYKNPEKERLYLISKKCVSRDFKADFAAAGLRVQAVQAGGRRRRYSVKRRHRVRGTRRNHSKNHGRAK
jgi:nicotinic acid mononucleotide adenylyltransferase